MSAYKTFTNAEIKGKLVKEGWRTPDTYCNLFQDIDAFPAVYLFLLSPRSYYEEYFVGYVGMSVNLKQRMAGHPILAEIAETQYWPFRWFKRVPKSDLRAVEAKYIREFNPPWNINGKRRGVIAA